ncbi:MAG: hypothetical protein AB7H88_22025 [Vicinamibacterales bacterium]
MSQTPLIRWYEDGSSIQLSCNDVHGIRPAWDVECRWRDGRLRFRHRVFAISQDEARRQADQLAPDRPGTSWMAASAGDGAGDGPPADAR